MVFRINEDNTLDLVEIDSDQLEFILEQAEGKTEFVDIPEENLPDNPYPVDAQYKYSVNNKGIETIELDTDRMLAEYKKEVIKNINKQKQAIIDEGYLWIDPETNEQYLIGLSDFDQKGLITLAIEALLGVTENLFFISKNNETISLTPDTAKDLALEVGNYVSHIVYQARTIKDQVLAAKTFEEVQTVIENAQNAQS